MSNEQNAVKEFTKRPVTIQAIQWTGGNLRAVITFMEGAVVTNDLASAARWDDYRDLVEKRGLIIKTLEGQHIASVGDWIIKGVKGEHYPCKPDIFEMTYAPAQQSAPAGWPTDDSADQLALLALVIAFHEEKHGGLRAAAKALGVDTAYLSRLKSGEKTSPSAEVLAAFGLERRSYYRPLLAAAPKAETVQGEK